MPKRLITVILFLFAVTSFAQTGMTEKPRPDSTGTSHYLFIPKSGTIISADHYFKDYQRAKTIDLHDSVQPPWPATYEEFKKAFIEMVIEDPLANLDLHLPSPAEMRNLAYPQGGIVMPGPISLLYDQFSKEARSKRIYAGLLKKDQVAVRYNNAVISKLTGLKNEEEIKQFIDFCALKVQFILDSSDYELYAAIMDCYGNFCISENDTVVPGERKTGW
jgi:hypothetical protein